MHLLEELEVLTDAALDPRIDAETLQAGVLELVRILRSKMGERDCQTFLSLVAKRAAHEAAAAHFGRFRAERLAMFAQLVECETSLTGTDG